MPTKRKSPGPVPIRVRRRNGLLTRHAIRRLARAIVERFDPERIILFGSYAYGKPDADSDVDLLVVMPARDEVSKAVGIYESVDTPFAVDVIVRTPERLERRLRWGDWFLREIVSRGTVLHDKAHRRLGPESRRGLRGRSSRKRKKADRA